MLTSINWSKYSYTEDEFRNAVKTSLSYRQVLLKLGFTCDGSGYKVIRRLIKLLELDATHFTGLGHLKNKSHNWGITIPLKEILIENSKYTSNRQLKKRLIKEGLLQESCQICGIIIWNNQKLSLHLDHINGINNDYRIENIRLLCPNCHSLTDTYCGKNTKKAIEKRNSVDNSSKTFSYSHKRKKKCLCCDNKITRNAKHCKSCSDKNKTKINWPSKVWILEQLKIKSFCALSEELKVSDNAIRKFLKRN